MEKDPHGKDQHEPGAKLDDGKNRLGLVLGAFSRALEGVGWVGTHGAAKYSPNGWLAVPNAQDRYTDALYRHLLKAQSGEKNDLDSGLPHMAHAAWCVLAILELQTR